MIVGFVESLFDHGNVRVGHPDQPIDDADWLRVEALLVDFEAIQRGELPGQPPPFDVAAAKGATRALYRACQAVTYRDIPAEAIGPFLGEPCPVGDEPSLHYSVDLLFQFLPDVSKFASQISAGDPLLIILQDWANHFPLSSVGMKNVTPDSLNGILTHPVLLRYYADRVIARRDATRLANPVVREAVQRAIGFHQHLFPELALNQTG